MSKYIEDLARQLEEKLDTFADGSIVIDPSKFVPAERPKPKRERTHTDLLNYSTLEIKFQLMTDGTNTLVQAVTEDEDGGKTLIAEGRSRRRKNDRRDEDAGTGLALERCFLELAARERRELQRKGL